MAIHADLSTGPIKVLFYGAGFNYPLSRLLSDSALSTDGQDKNERNGGSELSGSGDSMFHLMTPYIHRLQVACMRHCVGVMEMINDNIKINI
jgi:hypothetical protein